MQMEVFGRVDPQQVAQEAGVQKVQLGALDQPFAEVSMMRPQEGDQKARLEDREPSPGRGVGDAGIVCEGRQIEELPVSARAQTDEPAERLDVANVDDFANMQKLLRAIGALEV